MTQSKHSKGRISAPLSAPFSPLFFGAIVLFGALLFSGCAEFSDFDEDELASSEKIIGGYDDQAPPYMVSIRKNNRHICGGSLVRGDWVLTAAHCVDWPTSTAEYRQLSVCVGSTKLSECGPINSAALIGLWVHPGWTRELLNGHDIALIQLDRPFPGATELADADFEPPSGTLINARGWGVTDYNGNERLLTDHMQRIKLPYWNARDCHERFDLEGERTSNRETIICLESKGTITEEHAEASVCNGDSGGPLHYHGRQVGLVSYTLSSPARKCLGGYPSGHTRVSTYRSWIDRIIKLRDQQKLSPREQYFATGRLISLRSVSENYVSAETGGGRTLTADRRAPGEWETFEVIDLERGRIALRTHTGRFFSAEGGGGGALNAMQDRIGPWETFTVLDLGGGEFAFETQNNHLVTVEGGGTLRADRRTIVRVTERFTVRDLTPTQDPNVFW